MDKILDAAMNQAAIGDKVNKKLAEELQDAIMTATAVILYIKNRSLKRNRKHFSQNSLSN